MLGSEAPQLQSSVFNVQQANSLTVQHCNTTTPSPSTAILVQVLAQGAPMLRALWLARAVVPPSRHGGWRQQLLLQPEEEVVGGTISMFAAGLLLDWSDGVLSAAKFQRYLSLVFSAPFFKEFLVGLHFLTYSKTF